MAVTMNEIKKWWQSADWSTVICCTVTLIHWHWCTVVLILILLYRLQPLFQNNVIEVFEMRLIRIALEACRKITFTGLLNILPPPSRLQARWTTFQTIWCRIFLRRCNQNLLLKCSYCDDTVCILSSWLYCLRASSSYDWNLLARRTDLWV